MVEVDGGWVEGRWSVVEGWSVILLRVCGTLRRCNGRARSESYAHLSPLSLYPKAFLFLLFRTCSLSLDAFNAGLAQCPGALWTECVAPRRLAEIFPVRYAFLCKQSPVQFTNLAAAPGSEVVVTCMDILSKPRTVPLAPASGTVRGLLVRLHWHCGCIGIRCSNLSREDFTRRRAREYFPESTQPGAVIGLRS